MLALTSYPGIVQDGVIRLHDIRLPEGTPVLVHVAETATETAIHNQERKRRAIAAAGRYRSGLANLSVEHDRYLPEAYQE
jgi:hypothetical protein